MRGRPGSGQSPVASLLPSPARPSGFNMGLMLYPPPLPVNELSPPRLAERGGWGPREGEPGEGRCLGAAPGVSHLPLCLPIRAEHP